MKTSKRALSAPGATALFALACILLSACGSGSSSSVSSTPSVAGSTQTSETGALAADARSAATGDIPDNQNFLTYNNSSPRFAMIYPEGWTVKKVGGEVTFKDKNNLVRIVVAPGATPTPPAAQAQLAALKRSQPTLVSGAAHAIVLKSGPAVKLTYTTQSAPNPVTGKSVTLMVDRYELAHGGQVATIDLGTPTGVDNVDAYKKMVASYRWG
ncbi:MAG TPA: hypothetical protein VGY76_12425 [Solirubrobacteraceae bacterium]|jgi:hypothetical protein|nr:hypothetical protein [Solirubrobacteraceae bacterium]